MKDGTLVFRTNIHRADDDTDDTSYTPPNPYADGIAKLRAAAETPESSFVERYKADRLRELEEEYRVAECVDAVRPELRLITELARRLTYGQ